MQDIYFFIHSSVTKQLDIPANLQIRLYNSQNDDNRPHTQIYTACSSNVPWSVLMLSFGPMEDTAEMFLQPVWHHQISKASRSKEFTAEDTCGKANTAAWPLLSPIWSLNLSDSSLDHWLHIKCDRSRPDSLLGCTFNTSAFLEFTEINKDKFGTIKKPKQNNNKKNLITFNREVLNPKLQMCESFFLFQQCCT